MHAGDVMSNLTPVEEDTRLRKRVVADWVVELNCDCPHCDEHIDLLECPDFWDGRHGLQVGMSHHYDSRAKGLHEVCPKCGGELEVDCEY